LAAVVVVFVADVPGVVDLVAVVVVDLVVVVVVAVVLSPVTFWALFIQYCTLLKYSEYETATSFPFFVTDYFQVRQVG
jgi:hypothetical protein